MKKLTFFISILLIIQSVNAQITFQKTYGGTGEERGYTVQQTTDGGYIICGSITILGGGTSDVYLVKTDSIGNLLWTRSFGGSNNDVGTSVQLTIDGGYIITGTTSSFGAGNDDIYLIKTNANSCTKCINKTSASCYCCSGANGTT